MPIRSHVVRRGESLSKIALQYGFGTNWKPLWIFNERHQRIRSHDPERIQEGETLLIPRTADEYDRAIEAFKALAAESREQMLAEQRELARAKDEADYVGKVVDAIGAVATALVSAGSKLIHASAKLGPRYYNYTVRKEFLKVLNKAAEQAYKFSDGAAFKDVGEVQKIAGGMVERQAYTIAAGQGFSPGKAVAGDVKEFVKEKAKKLMAEQARTSGAAVGGMAGSAALVANAAFVAADALDAGVEAPSTWAKAYVMVVTGEHPDLTYAHAKQLIESAIVSTQMRIGQTIARFKEEKSLLYGSVTAT